MLDVVLMPGGGTVAAVHEQEAFVGSRGSGASRSEEARLREVARAEVKRAVAAVLRPRIGMRIAVFRRVR